MEIETLESKVVYENRWMRVREDRIRRANGSEGIYGVVEKPNFAVIIPLIGDGVVLVQQFRYPVGQRFWEFPAGAWEDGDLRPAEVAALELRQETGYRATELVRVGELCEAYGYSTQRFTVFVARGLVAGPAELEDEEQGLVTRVVTRAEFERMILGGEVQDSATVAAYGLARLKGEWER